MSCINVSVQHLNSKLPLHYTKEAGINANISRVNCDKLSISFGILCTVSITLGWELDQLVWSYEDCINNIIKYNTLITDQDWYLEENDIQGFEITPQNGKAGTHNISIRPTHANESIDKFISIWAIYGDTVSTFTIIHEGKREVFNTSDTEFILKEGGTFNVIKNEL